ncbi:hypothetical protein QR680_003034 [Steinernema hermaphroditum]|uniref:Uncharacterized protein n=1 Tax=Steinernema hermaphroditum TaxID=289476 RepID=A0AA39H548_9BILA|nr:hypothetical protein QR680_003034 [Steinernema hermaphroditum]
MKFAVLSIVILPLVYAAGGIAEMKGITGYAPYLGSGNQEIAGEYYVSKGQLPYSSYYMYNRPYYQQYYSPCRRNGYNGYNYNYNNNNNYNYNYNNQPVASGSSSGVLDR